MGLKGYLNAALRDEWDGLERITRDIRPADLVTLANAVTGLLAILAAARGNITAAASLILVGILLDGLDGAVARIGGGGGPLGGALDALSDVVTFAVAPATLLVLATPSQPVFLIVAGFYLATVVLRLARFEALRQVKDSRYFSGLSSPGGALLLASAILVGASPAVLIAVAAVAGLLMTSRIRYPKLRGWLGIVAVLLIVASLLAPFTPLPEDIPVLAMAGFLVFYVVAGPFYVLARIGPTEAT